MTVKNQKEIKWINDCDCLVDEQLLTKATLWKSNSPMISIKHIYKHGQYAAVTINGKKIHIHRLLMEYEINSDIPRTFCVHHLDGNKLNDDISNLCIMVAGPHNSHHIKNHILTDYQRKKISETGKKRSGLKIRRTVRIPVYELKSFLKEGKNISWIANYYKCDWSTVKRRINENADLSEVSK